MVEDSIMKGRVGDFRLPEVWLLRAQEMVPVAICKAMEVKAFPGRWKMIISKVEQIPSRLSDLSNHPFFSKNVLCKEQLQAVSKTLEEVVKLAEICLQEKYEGKLRMQNDLDSLSGKLDLNLRDCGHLIKTGVLGEATLPVSITGTLTEPESTDNRNVRELLARLQIGRLEAKHRALDGLVEVMKEDEKTVVALLGRNNISALIQLLAATSPYIREKAATAICSIVDSESCKNWLISEGVLPPLIRLVESGSAICKEKAAIALQKLSTSAETAREIVGHGGAQPLIEICRTSNPVMQAAAVCTLKNMSTIPEVRQSLADEGIVRVTITLLGSAILLESKKHAAECLQNLTAGSENLRKSVVSEGGIQCLLVYIDGTQTQEFAIRALRNLVSLVPIEVLTSLGILPCLLRVVRTGSLGAKQAAASAICVVSSSPETKKILGEAGFIPPLIKMLEAKSNNVREVAAQAIASLMTVSRNSEEVKKEENSVPNLVMLLDSSPHNTAKKYAVSCLVNLALSKKCKKLMISHGAIGYLKKLVEMEVPGANKLLERLERGNLSIFGRK